MIISLRWLSDFVDVSDYWQKPEALGEILTRAGLEVENITDRAKDFRFVVTGLILEKAKHPNADKLSVCRVSTGEGVVHQIVCGAQNHNANDHVIVALPGAVLPGNFAIKQSAIRGVDSGGMLCSDKELGLATESNGIKILPATAPIGQPFAEYAGLNDITFELKVTPNRADCLSHFGLAREVACLLGRPLRHQILELAVAEESTRQQVQVEVKDSAACPRYTGRFIAGVKVGPSPVWIQKRLESVGVNSINNVVDITNYVMLERGQPLHAFDADQLQGRKLTVERAKAGEAFQSLDGTQFVLKGEELLIRDQVRAVALAGVVGGQNSGVSDTTQNIFLESAYFSPAVVRKSARTHGITTDSAYRFSRGVDPDGTARALDRAAELIVKVAGGKAFGSPYDIYPEPVQKYPVEIALKTISARLGYPAKAEQFVDFMTRLGCVVEALTLEGDTEPRWKVRPPLFRFDLEIDMDLVEEYARLNGYEHIPETLPVTQMEPASMDAEFVNHQQWGRIWRSLGFRQAINLAMTSGSAESKWIAQPQNWKHAGLEISEKPIALLNPLSEDIGVMRRTLSWGLLRVLRDNVHQGNEVGQIYETGKTFSLKAVGEYLEHWRFGVAWWGNAQGLWTHSTPTPLVLQAKASVEESLRQAHIKSWQWLVPSSEQAFPFLHSGQQVFLKVEGEVVGWLGTLHPLWGEDLKLRIPVVLGEFKLPILVGGISRVDKFKSVSKMPVVERDLALVMKKSQPAGDVLKELQKLLGPVAINLSILDLYEGNQIEVGMKSVTYRLRLQEANATLQDEAVQALIAKAITGLQTKFGVQAR